MELEIVSSWFSASHKPQYKGEYEISTWPEINPVGRGVWNGAIWTNPDTGKPMLVQSWQWRGLAVNPKVGK